MGWVERNYSSLNKRIVPFEAANYLRFNRHVAEKNRTILANGALARLCNGSQDNLRSKSFQLLITFGSKKAVDAAAAIYT